MFKKIIVTAILLTFLLQSAAFAGEVGRIAYNDAMYGAIIGGILGTAFYFADPVTKDKDETFMKRVSIGVILGTLGGLAFGVYDAQSAVSMKNGNMQLNVPTVNVVQRGKETLYTTNFLEVKF